MKFVHKIISALTIGVLCSVLFVSACFARDGVVTASVLNIREYPSYEASIIGQLNSNTMVNAYDSEKDGWYVINYGDRYAYVASEYIKLSNTYEGSNEKVCFDKPIYGKSTVNGLNIRNGARFDCTIVDTAYKGTKFVIQGEENGFFIVSIDGIERFVFAQYIDVITEEEYNSKPEGAEALIEEAMKYIGTPYVYGGSSPRGFDCSGFTSYIYKQFGIKLNRTAAGQASNGIAVSKGELEIGDIVLFNNYRGGVISHVGIYVGDGNMIHAPRTGERVRIETIDSGYYCSRYVGARRIL